ncbi:hypothetical protein IP88_04655 [alpha proteobacterium AAP81b]|nr:hypothetical protein IP88_04655 [alpha proteobacterium AAP81b]
MLWERLFAGAVVIAAAAAAGNAMLPDGPPAVAAPAALRLDAAPLPLNPDDRAQDRVGALRFAGAVQLSSPDRLFGGLSGLRWRDDGSLVAVSDTGNWLSFRPVERGGRLVGAEGGRIAAIVMADGRPAATKADGDAEALEWTGGVAEVFFEQDHRLQRYRAAATGALPDGAPTDVRHVTPTIAWPSNGGGEAFARLDAEAALAISEQGRGRDGHHDALLLTAAGATRLAIAPPRGFSPTDAVLLDANRLLLLTRRFDGVSVAAKLVLVDLGALQAARRAGGVPADLLLPSRELATLAPPLTLDNMEGLALRREGGRVFLYLVSDDNLSPAQRTLLMKFELDP